MALSPGTRLGPYEILEPLGAGGMGEIYRARDPRLEREVAIKVLPEATARDPDRLRRLEREARAASALNHPNIVTVYDIGEHDGTRFIAMEHVEGRTLREILGEGALPPEKMLPIATQIGEALAKAHAAEIVHRDLKPENVMVTGDGLVKVLDFGLAKRQRPVGADGSEMPTETRATREGAIVGTAQYMSPEQAAGRAVDYRSDQFSLGLILYEMVTGKPAFKRDSVPQTQAAIIEDAIEPMNPGSVPAHFPVIVDRCLAKEPEERYDSTRDLARELKSLSNVPPDRRGGVTAATPPTARERLQSLAVLPLQNLSGDPEQEYFSDGMTEALIADLARIKALDVTSRQSVMRYKRSDEPLPEIARALGVEAVVEGSVLRAGSRVRVTAQLIEAGTDRHLWADSFDREMEDVFALFSDVARSIAKEVQANLTPEEEAGLAENRPVNPDSYDAYLMGRYHVSKRTPDGLGKAIEYYQEAIRLQPDNALAHSGLGEAYAFLGIWGWAPARDVLPPARAAAVRALETDRTLSEAHLILATIGFHFEWDWDGSRRGFERAIDLKPGNADAHANHGMYLASLGRFEQAATAAERALELDPLSVVCNDAMTMVLYFCRRFDEVLGQARKLLELSPTSPAGHWGLAFAYHKKGMYSESWAAQAKGSAAIGFQDVTEAMERGHEEGGYSGAMREGANALVERRQQHHFSPVWIAILFAFGEDKKMALQWLETGVEERDPFLVYARVAPYWDSLRSEPRFEDLVRRIAIPSEGPAET